MVIPHLHIFFILFNYLSYVKGFSTPYYIYFMGKNSILFFYLRSSIHLNMKTSLFAGRNKFYSINIKI